MKAANFKAALFILFASTALSAADPAYYVKKETWQETMLASRQALAVAQKAAETTAPVKVSTDVMRGGDPGKEMKVPVSGWKDLWLIVDDVEDYDHDMADWADACVIGKDGKVLYLDTIDPVSVRQGWGQFHRNKNVLGGPIAFHDKAFARGLGTHAISVIHYDLQGKYDTFTAWVGVDKAKSKNQGSVRFIVSSADVSKTKSLGGELWDLVARDFNTPTPQRQIAWERDDKIWETDSLEAAALAKRYAGATRGQLGEQVGKLAGEAKDVAALQPIRELYYRFHQVQQAMSQLKGFSFQSLRLAVTDLNASFGEKYVKGAEYLKRVDDLEKTWLEMTADGKKADPAKVGEVSEKLAALQQEALLANPLLDFDKLLLIKRNAKNLGLPQNWQSNSTLHKNGFENEIQVMSPVKPGSPAKTFYKPDGGKFVGDMCLHFDAQKMLFSSIGANGRWHIFEIGIDGQNLRQVTQNDQPDVDYYDACYLPNGKIAMNSTACFNGVPCVFGSDHVSNLYVMDSDGKNIRQLCVDQEHDWSPTVLPNGQIMYLRWEYTDTPHSNTRLLFHCNPDGTEQLELYHSNSYWPNGMFYAKPIPDHPSKVVGIVTGHHGVPRMGELVIIDPAAARNENEGVVQRIPGYGKKVDAVYADQLVNGSWPKFLHPWPLNEKYFLVAAQPTAQSLWGIYLVDVYDNMLLLAESPGYALLQPVPVKKTPTPPVIPEKVDPSRHDATVYISNIYQGEGMKGVPKGTVKQLRIFTYHFAYQGMGGLLGVLGMDGPWDIRRIMGTVPVEPDGSVRFRIPANTPISMQPLDDHGCAVQLMRSWITGMPGENVSCAGCHEKQTTAPVNQKAVAFSKPTAEIKPWYGPVRGFAYKREVQPVLDKHCIGCHDGKEHNFAGAEAGTTKVMIDLRGTEKIKDFRMETPGNGGGHAGRFSVGYAELHRFVRHATIESDYHTLTPGEYHAENTELIQMLRKGHYNVKLDAESWDRLITWIDLHAPYHGTWNEELVNPGKQIERRRELRKLYAGIDENPEEVPPTKPSEPFVMPVAPASLPAGTEAGATASGWPFDAAEAAKRQAAAGGVGKQTIDLGNGIKLDLVLVPAGEFVMGDANGEADEKPLTKVKIDKPFWMGRCEVTNAQYNVFDALHDSHCISKQAYQFGVHGFPSDKPEQPVIRVSWDEAMAYCKWLSTKTGQKFSLPTEAQWEYACRAGSASPLFFGDTNSDFSTYANVADKKLRQFASNPYTVFEPLKNPSKYEDYTPKDDRFDDGGLVSVEVGRYKPNAWGLHDMHGNVAEWTRTTYKPYPYDSADGRDNGESGTRKVARGGSWRDRPKCCRSGFRQNYPYWQRVFNVGFRVICEAPPEAKIAVAAADK
ncbi:MAG TPA: SUMF1/EgtB/PvdO family nonheme iron enzyme [Planctomycetota bacterium]|jgi:formylglycine-generating enzyme required for sulfatase activity